MLVDVCNMQVFRACKTGRSANELGSDIHIRNVPKHPLKFLPAPPTMPPFKLKKKKILGERSQAKVYVTEELELTNIVLCSHYSFSCKFLVE